MPNKETEGTANQIWKKAKCRKTIDCYRICVESPDITNNLHRKKKENF